MLATVAWFFWNPDGWIFQWEPIVVFLLSLAGFISAEIKGSGSDIGTNGNNAHPNDIQLFNDFILMLPSETFVEFLKEHDFLGDFELESLAPLRQFIYEWDNAAHEFQDAALEKIRKELMDAAKDVNHKISKYTSPNSSGWQAVRVDNLKHQDEHEARFRREAGFINEAVDVFVEKHQELVRKGRQTCIVTTQSN